MARDARLLCMCMYVCMYVGIYVYTYIYPIYTYVYTYIYPTYTYIYPIYTYIYLLYVCIAGTMRQAHMYVCNKPSPPAAACLCPSSPMNMCSLCVLYVFSMCSQSIENTLDGGHILWRKLLYRTHSVENKFYGEHILSRDLHPGPHTHTYRSSSKT